MSKKILNYTPLILVVGLASYFFIIPFLQDNSPLYNCIFTPTHEQTLDPDKVEYIVLGTYPATAGELYYRSLYFSKENPLLVGYQYEDIHKYGYVSPHGVKGPFSVRPEFRNEQFDYAIKRASEGRDDTPLSYYLEEGWPTSMKPAHLKTIRSLSKNGHTLSWTGAGGVFKISTGSHKKSQIRYDGEIIGTHVADCAFYEPVDKIFLSENGKHYAYLFQSHRSFYLVVDGKLTDYADVDWAEGDTYTNPHFVGNNFVYYTLNSQTREITMVKVTTD